MVRGQFVHSIDATGRVSVPARFRDAIVVDGDTRLLVTPSPADPCLHLHRFSDWLEFEKRIAELPRFDSHIVRFRRLYVSAALECEIDKAGRLLIAPDFREKARLSRAKINRKSRKSRKSRSKTKPCPAALHHVN
jgi:MraZ protein